MSDYIIRYGVMRFLGVFSAPAGQTFRRGMQVITRTDRGLEAGEILADATPEALGRLTDPPTGQILRTMTPEDANELARIEKHTGDELAVCQRYIDQLELKMQLVDLERISAASGSLSTTWPTIASISANWSVSWPASFKPASKCGKSESATKPSFWPTTATAVARSAATHTWSRCPRFPCDMAKLQKATLDPTKISGRAGV